MPDANRDFSPLAAAPVLKLQFMFAQYSSPSSPAALKVPSWSWENMTSARQAVMKHWFEIREKRAGLQHRAALQGHHVLQPFKP